MPLGQLPTHGFRLPRDPIRTDETKLVCDPALLTMRGAVSPPRAQACIHSIIEDWVDPAGNQTNGRFRRSRNRTVFRFVNAWPFGHCQDHSILREFPCAKSLCHGVRLAANPASSRPDRMAST